jgi:DNA-directed RNA polymerase subunit RPC12/RpoP
MEQQSGYLENTISPTCPSCGSNLAYSAELKKIACDYCGYKEDIDHSNDKILEQSLQDAVNSSGSYVPEDVGKKVFDCQNCGAKFMVEAEQVKVNCGFCGSKNVNLEAFDHKYIQPIGIVPFYISRFEAEKIFEKWIRRGWFHPNKLKRLAAVEDLHGIYIPFWTYDAHTESEWQGEAGYYYYETKMVRINGKMKSKQIRKTRWKYRSGHLTHFFDDVLVVASGGLEQKHIERVLPFRLEEMVNFDGRLMVGWESEVYKIEVDEGHQVADKIMDHKIRNMCSAQLGGDTQRNLYVDSNKSQQTFKHVVLPLWICSYMYNNKIYQFTINGQTGKVNGQKPLSWGKIAILILVFVLFLVGVWYLRESGVLRG